MTTQMAKVAVVWRGDRAARNAATTHNNRFHRVFEELSAIGIHAEPAVYDEEFAEEVRALSFWRWTVCWSGSIRCTRGRPERRSTPCCATSRHADLG